jgi:hypothetical protein
MTMDETSRNTSEIIMQIHNVFRYADPVFRLTTIGTIKLIQFLARMAKEKQLSDAQNGKMVVPIVTYLKNKTKHWESSSYIRIQNT